jgi:hypothetical protein
MNKLRLGPIVEDKPIKVTVELHGALHRRLVEYTAAHAKENGLPAPLSPERLIAPMIERFMETDRGFAKHRNRS